MDRKAARIVRKRKRSLARLETTLADIYARYGHDFEGTDVVDIATGEVVENHGLLEAIKPVSMSPVHATAQTSRRRDVAAAAEAAEGALRPLLKPRHSRGDRAKAPYTPPTAASSSSSGGSGNSSRRGRGRGRGRDAESGGPGLQRFAGRMQSESSDTGENTTDHDEAESGRQFVCGGEGRCGKPFCFNCAVHQ